MPLRRRKHMDLVLPTSSMGDIAFLLIIFFMLASNFMKSANVELENAQSEDIDTVDAGEVSVVMDAGGLIYVQGIEATSGEVSSAVTQAVGDHRDRPVHVRIDKNLTKTQFMPVIEALGEAGVKVILEGDKM